ncbi:MAG: dihydropyrimidinase [Herpetosiphon sp.]
MADLDLVVRGGRIVGGGDVVVADVGIADGRIVRIGHDLQADATVDAHDCYVLPGGIDAHVHLSSAPGSTAQPRWVDDFASGSAAALAGGITTLGNMTALAAGETPRAGHERQAAVARGQTIADLFLHPILDDVTTAALDDIPALPGIGCNSIKIFTSAPGFDAQILGYLEAIDRAGTNGLLTLMHCEDYPLMKAATDRLVRAGKTSLQHYYGLSRPPIAEVVATQRAVGIAEVTGAPIYLVHLSSARCLAICAEAQSRGVPVYVETRPLYLHLTEERLAEADGPKYIGQPPLRKQHDVDALWAGIQAGSVQTVCTDHAPWTLEAKLDPSLSITKLRPGVENLQTMLPMLFSEGVLRGRITLNRFVEVTSTNAARLFGLYPRKGVIAPGSDADLVVFDPNLTRTVEASMLKSRAGYSVYDGWQVTGWPRLTIRRGEVVFRDDEVIGVPGSGQLVQRGPTQPLPSIKVAKGGR